MDYWNGWWTFMVNRLTQIFIEIIELEGILVVYQRRVSLITI